MVAVQNVLLNRFPVGSSNHYLDRYSNSSKSNMLSSPSSFTNFNPNEVVIPSADNLKSLPVRDGDELAMQGLASPYSGNSPQNSHFGNEIELPFFSNAGTEGFLKSNQWDDLALDGSLTTCANENSGKASPQNQEPTMPMSPQPFPKLPKQSYAPQEGSGAQAEDNEPDEWSDPVMAGSYGKFGFYGSGDAQREINENATPMYVQAGSKSNPVIHEGSAMQAGHSGPGGQSTAGPLGSFASFKFQGNGNAPADHNKSNLERQRSQSANINHHATSSQYAGFSDGTEVSPYQNIYSPTIGGSDEWSDLAMAGPYAKFGLQGTGDVPFQNHGNTRPMQQVPRQTSGMPEGGLIQSHDEKQGNPSLSGSYAKYGVVAKGNIPSHYDNFPRPMQQVKQYSQFVDLEQHTTATPAINSNAFEQECVDTYTQPASTMPGKNVQSPMQRRQSNTPMNENESPYARVNPNALPIDLVDDTMESNSLDNAEIHYARYGRVQHSTPASTGVTDDVSEHDGVKAIIQPENVIRGRRAQSFVKNRQSLTQTDAVVEFSGTANIAEAQRTQPTHSDNGDATFNMLGHEDESPYSRANPNALPIDLIDDAMDGNSLDNAERRHARYVRVQHSTATSTVINGDTSEHDSVNVTTQPASAMKRKMAHSFVQQKKRAEHTENSDVQMVDNGDYGSLEQIRALLASKEGKGFVAKKSQRHVKTPKTFHGEAPNSET